MVGQLNFVLIRRVGHPLFYLLAAPQQSCRLPNHSASLHPTRCINCTSTSAQLRRCCRCSMTSGGAKKFALQSLEKFSKNFEVYVIFFAISSSEAFVLFTKLEFLIDFYEVLTEDWQIHIVVPCCRLYLLSPHISWLLTFSPQISPNGIWNRPNALVHLCIKFRHFSVQTLSITLLFQGNAFCSSHLWFQESLCHGDHSIASSHTWLLTWLTQQNLYAIFVASSMIRSAMDGNPSIAFVAAFGVLILAAAISLRYCACTRSSRPWSVFRYFLPHQMIEVWVILGTKMAA